MKFLVVFCHPRRASPTGAIVTQLCVGVLNYCGSAEARREMFYDTTSDDARPAPP